MTTTTTTTERTLSVAEAINEATRQEMEADSGVFVYGIGVDDFKGTWGTTKGLVEQFGADRVFDTPLSEDAMTGLGIGAALAGMRPIHVHIRMDFLLLCMNQLINIAAKSRYMFGGAVQVPLVVRAVIGRSWGQGAQHSQALQSMFMHVPGLIVVAPTTPYDAKGIMIESIRSDNPVIVVEHRMVHGLRGVVPEEPYTVPFGKARVLEQGGDITIVAVSHAVVEAVRAAHLLKDAGIRAEVIDPVTLSPLDDGAIAESVARTGRLLVVDNGWTMCGAGAEIVSRVVERLQGTRSIQVRRIGFAPVPCPTTRNLEDLFYPNPQTIADAAYRMVAGPKGDWSAPHTPSPEIVEFRGPF